MASDAQRPLCFRPMSSAGRPMSWPSSSFGDRNRRQDTGLQDLCPAVSESRDFLETEATAGIEPAMKVLQTSALPLGYVAEERRPRELARDGAATKATPAAGPTVADETRTPSRQRLPIRSS